MESRTWACQFGEWSWRTGGRFISVDEKAGAKVNRRAGILLEEKPAFGFSLRRIVGLPINILLNVIDGWIGTGFGKIRGMIRLSSCCLIDLGDGGVTQNALGNQQSLENLELILRPTVFFNLVL